MEKLSDTEVQRRLQQLRNYNKLHPELKEKYKQEKKLRQQLERRAVDQAQEIETLKLQIEELRVMVFGKKKRKDDDDNNPYLPTPKKKQGKNKRKKRGKGSYQRRVPQDEEVTAIQTHPIDTCPDCLEPLRNLKEVIRYKEDIVLPALEKLKHVVKQRIETGFCPNCRKQHSSIPTAKQMCSLGENVRARVVYCITVLGQTFSKTREDLKDTFGMEVSDGEIANILTEQALRLLPEYHKINSRIRGAPAKHCDETSWKVQKEGQGNYAWVKRASNTRDTIFLMGRSRGKGNAQALCDEQNQPTVTDDYPAYDFLGEHQVLCWAHPKRKFKDLSESSVLSLQNHTHCLAFYQSEREQAADLFRQRMTKLCHPDQADLKKLATLKATFLKRKERYLLCVLLPAIPMTNNAAEQALRPLVIKRKLSFGSKTQKGADVMSILMSVCFTYWWRNRDQAKQSWRAPENFYCVYQRIITQHQVA